MKFIGYSLLCLHEAIGDSKDSSTTCDYTVTIYSKMGLVERKVMKLGAIQKDWGKTIKMTGDRYAVMRGFDTYIIDMEEFNRLRAEWLALSDKS